MKKFQRERSKSLGHILLQPAELRNETQTNDVNDIRSVCRQVAPYIVRQWREVCGELGVSEDRLDEVSRNYESAKLSELAFHGLCTWIEMVGRSANTDRLLKAVRLFGLRRAEDELKSMQETKSLPCFAKPTTAENSSKEPYVNKQTKQKAAADRLARPKSRHSDTREQKTPRSQQLKRRPSFIADNKNPLLVRPSTSKQTGLCKMKIKISVNGVLRKGTEEMESTRDIFASTKDDFKQICHVFTKLVMRNQHIHFNQLKQRLGHDDIAVIGLDKVGFNIVVCVVCFSLGALEVMLQSYNTGRLRRIVHSCLVPGTYLETLGVADLDVNVSVDDDVINKNREIVINRNMSTDVSDHPIDGVEVCKYLLDEDDPIYTQYDPLETDLESTTSFNIRSWQKQLGGEIEAINSRLKTFLSTVNDFLLILRILKPAEKSVICCLQDVIECFHRIKTTKHLLEIAHSASVQEYLAIVNQARLQVQDIQRYACAIAFDESMTDKSNECFQCQLNELQEMLEPDFEFQLVVDQVEQLEPGLTLQSIFKDLVLDDGNQVPITSLERDAYGGCLCYIPALIGKLFKLFGVIDDAINGRVDHEIAPMKVTVLGESVGGVHALTKSSVNVNHAEHRPEQVVC